VKKSLLLFRNFHDTRGTNFFKHWCYGEFSHQDHSRNLPHFFHLLKAVFKLTLTWLIRHYSQSNRMFAKTKTTSRKKFKMPMVTNGKMNITCFKYFYLSHSNRKTSCSFFFSVPITALLNHSTFHVKAVRKLDYHYQTHRCFFLFSSKFKLQWQVYKIKQTLFHIFLCVANTCKRRNSMSAVFWPEGKGKCFRNGVLPIGICTHSCRSRASTCLKSRSTAGLGRRWLNGCSVR